MNRKLKNLHIGIQMVYSQLEPSYRNKLQDRLTSMHAAAGRHLFCSYVMQVAYDASLSYINVVLSDFHQLNMNCPCRDAQNKPAWRDRTWATHI